MTAVSRTDVENALKGYVDPYLDQDLVAANAEMAVAKETQLLRRQRQRLANAVEHDKVVTQALHFREFDPHSFTPYLCPNPSIIRTSLKNRRPKHSSS